MYSIKVEAGFSSAHNLRKYKGKCESLHGHNWRVEAVIRSAQLDSIGMVRDFKDFKSRLSKLLNEFDHKYLNDLKPFKKINPTSENIARYLYERLKKQIPDLSSVTVWENSTSAATYEE
jgi:6-pyruvoyltetrahydropterin/6-carboxytetrahydropterin synthase